MFSREVASSCNITAGPLRFERISHERNCALRYLNGCKMGEETPPLSPDNPYPPIHFRVFTLHKRDGTLAVATTAGATVAELLAEAAL